MEQDLFNAVKAHGKKTLPMHMPGHKRNTEMLGTDLPYDGDITEINGFDNLHDPEDGGILTSLSARAAKLYRAKSAYPLVNGTTCGILAAIRALADKDSEILVARNCHKSVYHAVELTGLRHACILPPTDRESGIYGSIRPSDVEAALRENPRLRTVVITSPTYEGVVSDTNAIAAVAHRYGARLIVDGAHGAHLGFFDTFPPFPMSADIVITSLHKTLPSLTQTALALVYAEDNALKQRLARELSVFETSSPSYVLLASIDRCIALLQRESTALFSAYSTRLDAFYEKCTALKHLSVLTGNTDAHPDFYSFDRGKIVILSHSEALTGTALADRLRREFSIEPEMAYTDYALCMTSICDGDESIDRLFAALASIDASLPEGTNIKKSGGAAVITALPEVRMTIAEAIAEPPAPLSAGEISRMYAWVYPPGVPLIVPGEAVTENALRLLSELRAAGLTVKIGR